MLHDSFIKENNHLYGKQPQKNLEIYTVDS